MGGFFLIASAQPPPGFARVRYPGAAGGTLWVVVERLAAGTFWDGSGFSAAPRALQAVESAAVRGRYALDIPTWDWPDGQYAVWPVIPGSPPSADTRFGTSSFALVLGDDQAAGPAVTPGV